MRIVPFSIAVLVLSACSSEPVAEQENADDFAGRIGQQEDAVAADPAALADRPNTAVAAAPQGADVTVLEQLGDIGGVDFGARDGGCAFMDGTREVLIASGVNEPTLPGKAVVRVGGGLVMLDGKPGGLASLKRGSTFTGDGVAVQVAPADGNARSRPANLSVTSAAGKTVTYSGKWICS